MLHSNGNHTNRKEGQAKGADILLVVGLGHVWVLQAEDHSSDPEHFFMHGEGLI